MAHRLPPSVSHLVIYNASLKPLPSATNSADMDDDDLIEQSHILYYTSRQRATSRDAMLRQVGLAKALVNFAEYVMETVDISETIF
jgi:hypothetical protein